jgi:hypothetical protein
MLFLLLGLLHELAKIFLFVIAVPSATPFPAGTRIARTMPYEWEKIAATSKVTYGRPDMGMGTILTKRRAGRPNLLE